VSCKATITELVRADCRTQAIGVYWAARSVGILPALLVGGLVWSVAGPVPMLWCAAALGGSVRPGFTSGLRAMTARGMLNSGWRGRPESSMAPIPRSLGGLPKSATGEKRVLAL
jgi:hypothetical protein